MMKPSTEKKSARNPLALEQSPKFGASAGMKRLTIDISAELHANVKAICARRGIKMSDAIRDILEEKFGKAQ